MKKIRKASGKKQYAGKKMSKNFQESEECTEIARKIFRSQVKCQKN